ncbi:M16 family metallopeptidase [Amycolatopsis suaedae]|uniref:Insulinase family protein n=1 Tax=Amycolatopsis suaedae TaxID=2510978 RepID=A0A4Q7J5V8_9PSEU|nr:insulinase family protein [Amycolatopsis suaedae]RZQ62980.1 insulinase family protein [Amycolatopsis suaedae]
MFPPVREFALANGLPVLAVERTVVPKLDLRLVVRTPGAGRGQRRAIAAYTGRLLATPVFADAGALVTCSVDESALTVSVSVLADALRPVLDALARALASAKEPAATAGPSGSGAGSDGGPEVWERRLLEHRYGTHPIAVPDGTRPARAWSLVPDDAVIVVVGPVDRAVRAALEDTVGRWERAEAGSTPVAPPLTPVSEPDVLVLRVPEGTRSSVLLAGPAAELTDPAHPAARVAEVVLGGHPASRLHSLLRQDLGLVYTAESAARRGWYGSWHLIEFSAAGRDVHRALEALGDLLTRLARGEVTDDEIASARRYAAAVPALATASQSTLASAVAGYAALRVPFATLAAFPALVRAIEPDQVREALSRWFRPELFHGILTAPASHPHPPRAGPWTLRT